MTNKKLIEKLKEDMEMRGFSQYTKDSLVSKKAKNTCKNKNYVIRLYA